MSLKVVFTPDGTVVREFHPSGEHAYRLHNNGYWHHCGDHKGPWVTVPHDQVPQRFKDAIVNAHTNVPQLKARV